MSGHSVWLCSELGDSQWRVSSEEPRDLDGRERGGGGISK